MFSIIFTNVNMTITMVMNWKLISQIIVRITSLFTEHFSPFWVANHEVLDQHYNSIRVEIRTELFHYMLVCDIWKKFQFASKARFLMSVSIPLSQLQKKLKRPQKEAIDVIDSQLFTEHKVVVNFMNLSWFFHNSFAIAKTSEKDK